MRIAEKKLVTDRHEILKQLENRSLEIERRIKEADQLKLEAQQARFEAEQLKHQYERLILQYETESAPARTPGQLHAGTMLVAGSEAAESFASSVSSRRGSSREPQRRSSRTTPMSFSVESSEPLVASSRSLGKRPATSPAVSATSLSRPRLPEQVPDDVFVLTDYASAKVGRIQKLVQSAYAKEAFNIGLSPCLKAYFCRPLTTDSGYVPVYAPQGSCKGNSMLENCALFDLNPKKYKFWRKAGVMNDGSGLAACGNCCYNNNAAKCRAGFNKPCNRQVKKTREVVYGHGGWVFAPVAATQGIREVPAGDLVDDIHQESHEAGEGMEYEESASVIRE